MRENRYLTKSRYVDGLVCPKLLWLGWHEPTPYEEPEPGSPAAVGIEIGKHAQKLFQGGVLVEAPPWEHEKAVTQTKELMEDPTVSALFEAAFEYENIRVRVDVLERLASDAWGIREVKSGTSVKPEHVDDAAIQFFVLQGLGLDIQSVELVHVNKDYVLGGDGINWLEYFNRTDISQNVSALMVDIEDQIADQLAVLRNPDVPSIQPGKHCPDHCPYWERCTAKKPSDWILKLPRISQKRFDELQELGIDEITQIPDDYPLNELQDRIRSVLKTGNPYISPGLRSALDAIGKPAFYLDFESMNPAIPLFVGTRPYQQIPFQWSLHQVSETGEVSHQEFLAAGASDPRREFAETLIVALENSDEPITVYSNFESWILGVLAEQFADLSDGLSQIRSRLVDLLKIVSAHLYLEEFDGSFSIKSVGPALVPGFGYDDLKQVSDGFGASVAFQKLVAIASAANDDSDSLREGLLRYCERDTLGMVKLHNAMSELASDSQGGRVAEPETMAEKSQTR